MNKPSQCKEQMKTHAFIIDNEYSTQLFKIAVEENITINDIVEVIWGLTLQSFTGEKDVVFGKVVSGRNAEINGIENILGLFINTIPARIQCFDKMKISELLHNRSIQNIESTSYDFVSLAEIQSQTVQKSDLIKTLLVFENYSSDFENSDDSDKADEQKGMDNHLNMNLVNVKDDTNYPITLTSQVVNKNGLYFEISYDANKYCSEEIIVILKRIEKISIEISKDISKQISDIETITEEEKHLIQNKFNATEAEYPRDKTVIELLEKMAEEKPERIALKYNGTEISFKELNERANRLGNELRNIGIGSNDFVLLIAERSNEMLEAIYGILKSGGAYVPVAPNTPDERIRFMIDDCGAKVVVTYGVDVPRDISATIIRYEEISKKEPEIKNPEKNAGSKDLAYMIYTSGTTGRPKGVMIEHQGLINLLSSYEKIYGMKEDDVVLQFASYCFDQSVWDIFSIVWSGNAVCAIPSEYIGNPEKLSEYMAQEGITITSLTPAYINILDPEKFKGLRLLDSSGEAGNLEVLKKWCRAGKRVINTYGPTEVTVNTSSYEVGADSEKLPIGKPIDNLKMYVVSGDNLCGIGVPGELCIAGDGLARGYLNRPELTAEKFVDNPFGEGKMYRSGDLARWLPDGNIEYLGRIDEQVKIRGFRIELGEIESRIREIEKITDCAVIARADSTGDKAIYAYYTSDTEIEVSDIRKILRKNLPEYMVPAYMMQIEAIPVTRNGKLDKRALPEIDLKEIKEYIAPKKETEKIICKVFSEILNVNQVGVTDNFFELGGHSLKAIKIVNELRKVNIDVSVADVMIKSQISELAEFIDNKLSVVVEEITYDQETFEEMMKTEVSEILDTKIYNSIEMYKSSIQMSQVVNEYIPLHMQYNLLHEPIINLISLHFLINGSVSKEDVICAVENVIREQEVLRCAYNKNTNKIYVYDPDNYIIPYDDELSDLTRRAALIIGKPVLRSEDKIGLFKDNSLLSYVYISKNNDDNHEVWFYVHHAVWDDMSNSILEDRINYYIRNKKIDTLPQTFSQNIAEKRETKENINIDSFLQSFINASEKLITVLGSREGEEINVNGCSRISKKYFDYFKNNAISEMVQFFVDLNDLNCLEYIPVKIMYHGRNTKNGKTLGMYLDYLPGIYHVKEKVIEGGENFIHDNMGLFSECFSDLFKRGALCLNYGGIFMNSKTVFDTNHDFVELVDKNRFTFSVLANVDGDFLQIRVPMVSTNGDAAIGKYTEYIKNKKLC